MQSKASKAAASPLATAPVSHQVLLYLQEGSQFCRGFGGIGGLLRYSVNLAEFEAPDEDEYPEWNSDEDI